MQFTFYYLCLVLYDIYKYNITLVPLINNTNNISVYSAVSTPIINVYLPNLYICYNINNLKWDISLRVFNFYDRLYYIYAKLLVGTHLYLAYFSDEKVYLIFF